MLQEHGQEHGNTGQNVRPVGDESVDMAAGDGVTVAAFAPGAGHPECGAISETPFLIRIANEAREAKARRGRRWPKPASVVVSLGGPRWHCIEVAPRAEHLAAAAIEALGLVALVPQYLGAVRGRERVGGVLKVVDRPALLIAFPRYIFAEFDASGRGWRQIATRHGVKRLIGADPERPLAVPAVQMAWVIAQFGEDGVQRRPVKPAAPIAAGCLVRVMAGPLDGHVARVVRSTGRTVVVEWAGRPVTMAQAAVQVVEAAGPPQP